MDLDSQKLDSHPRGRGSRRDSADYWFDYLVARLDAAKRKCTTGYSCGATCITVKKECRSNPAAATSRERLQRLGQLAKGEIKPRGIGVPKAEEARAMAAQLQAQRQQQQTLIKAERQRRREQAAATGQKPSVKVNLRRAKPGGEYGPDGHWYPGGSWMSEGAYVGIKSQPMGTGSQAGRGEGEKGGNLEPRVIQPKAKPRRIRPLEPRGEGLPRPTGLKKTAAQNDQEWFNDRGYLIYPRPEGSQYRGLKGSHFEAAVIQRMTTKELQWATSQILRMAKRSPEDHAEMLLRVKDTDDEIKRMGGLEAWAENERWTSRRQLIGVDDKRLRAGLIFMDLSGFLGSTSPAAQRLRKQWREYDEDRAPLPEFPGEEGARAWTLNNVFRAVARRRKAASGSRLDALQPLIERLERLDARIKQAPGQLGLELGGKGKGRGPGGGQPCGKGWISPDKTCRKGAAGVPLHPLFQEAMERRQAKAAAAATAQKKAAQAQSAPGLQLGQDQQGQLLVNGKPVKRLSKGNYGDTYKVDTPEGPVLVKVDRLNGGDPLEDDPGVSREQQRLNMANRELENLRRAAALGVGPEPIGEVVKLPADGRFAIAYRMVEGAPLKASFTSTEPDTPEAAAILARPGARERLDAGVLRIARVMADAGLEHGDLHGANIVVQRDGSPKLIDWGIGGQDPPGDAANRAQLEARLLLQMNYYTQTLNRHSPDGKAVAEGLGRRLSQAEDGLRAARDLQNKFDIEWEEEHLSPDEWMPRMREASRLRKQGLSSDEAQRQAGVLPIVTPQMKMATDQAREALFSDADLMEMRRWVDQQVIGAGR